MKIIVKNLMVIGVLLSIPAMLNAGLTNDFFNATNHIKVGTSQVNANSGTLTAGDNNVVDAQVFNASALGMGLRAKYSGCLVAGKYNRALPAGSSAVFIVGNGTGLGPNSEDAPYRQNAMEVWDTGTVYMPQGADIKKVPAKGGISMGDYTAN